LYELSLHGGGDMTADPITPIITLQQAPCYRELLSDDLIELWEERAAIMEYEGRLSREEAEWQAFLCVQSLDEIGKDL